MFQRSKRTADYRLQIPYKAFLRGSARDRERLLEENVLTVVADLTRKTEAARLDFHGERLAADIKKRFKVAKQLNSTPPPDARRGGAPNRKPIGARAGGRGR